MIHNLNMWYTYYISYENPAMITSATTASIDTTTTTDPYHISYDEVCELHTLLVWFGKINMCHILFS